MDDAYWVVIVNRETGHTSSVLIGDADEAHRLAKAYTTDRQYATVVGRR